MFIWLYKFFTSLRLTVVLLGLGLILVFAGTIAQVHLGLYQAQNEFFRSLFVHWQPKGSGLRIPVFPGGYLVGGFLLANLFAAHLRYYKPGWRKLGIALIHLGVVMLLLGQLLTDFFSQETTMRFAEGESRRYSESPASYELVFVSDADATSEEVVSISESRLKQGGEIRCTQLPFAVRVRSFSENSAPSFRPPMAAGDGPVSTNGIARYFDFTPQAVSHAMDEKNVPTAVLELVAGEKLLGTWVASGWAGDSQMVLGLRRSLHRRYSEQLGDAQASQMAATIAGRMTEPQVIETGGKKFTMTLRPVREYHPFSITLLQTTHATYRGRPDLPKDFRSRVRIEDAARRETREVEIFMNAPLRYAGLTFYQSQMDQDEMAMGRGISGLQVVRNPAWLTPYFACVMVALGMMWQFSVHLFGIGKETRRA